MKKGFKVLDLFCGAGGLSTGFKSPSFDVVLGVDYNAPAIETFKENHPDSKSICGNIREISSQEILEKTGGVVDIIVGGPPCQGFSMAGRRQPNDPRNSLFKEYLRIVRELKPKAFIMENVRGLLSMKNEKGESVIDIILNEFEKIEGYKIELYKVNTADYGVPQRRQRIFIIGFKGRYNFKFPEKTHAKNPEGKLKKWVGIGSVIIDKSKVDKKYFYSDKLIRGFLRREEINKRKGVGFGWQFNKPDQPSYTLSARYWKDGAESLVRYGSREIRMLTPKECAAIQSFPKDYKFKGNEREIYTQIGNAVPPKMAEMIAGAVEEALT